MVYLAICLYFLHLRGQKFSCALWLSLSLPFYHLLLLSQQVTLSVTSCRGLSWKVGMFSDYNLLLQACLPLSCLPKEKCIANYDCSANALDCILSYLLKDFLSSVFPCLWSLLFCISISCQHLNIQKFLFHWKLLFICCIHCIIFLPGYSHSFNSIFWVPGTFYYILSVKRKKRHNPFLELVLSSRLQKSLLEFPTFHLTFYPLQLDFSIYLKQLWQKSPVTNY